MAQVVIENPILNSPYREPSRHFHFSGLPGSGAGAHGRDRDARADESAWASLYSTVSRPFAPPASGKLAVKVINHYGDEVLKVFRILGRWGGFGERRRVTASG